MSFDIDGTEFPAYLYDLTPSYDGGIPSDLSYAPDQKDLATVTNRFVGDGTGLAIESRSDCQGVELAAVPVGLRAGPAGQHPRRLRLHPGGQRLVRVVDHPAGWRLRGDRLSCDEGEQATRTWLDTVVRPRTRLRLLAPAAQRHLLHGQRARRQQR